MNNRIDLSSFILEVYSVYLLLQDFNNTDLMQELQRQDNEYFRKIIDNQEEILNLLRKEEKPNERWNVRKNRRKSKRTN